MITRLQTAGIAVFAWLVALVVASTLPGATLRAEESRAVANYTVYHVECTNENEAANLRKLLGEEHPRSAHVFCQFGKFFDVFVASDETGASALRTIESHPGFFWQEQGREVIVPAPPVSRPGTGKRGDADVIVREQVAGLTGKGVIVAILDTGIDFHNRDFIKIENGQPVSRLLYYWDTFARPPEKFDLGRAERAPATYPNGVGVGALYTQQELTEAIRENDRSIATDEGGHGTGCATIAVGNGAASQKKHTGVASQADIVAVRIGKSGNMDHAYLLNAACGWLDEVGRRLNKQVVVSCSYGGLSGGRDGNDVETRHLNARFAAEARGRAICFSAGNSGYEPIYTQLQLAAGDAVELRWRVPNANYPSLQLRFDSDDPGDVAFDGADAARARQNLVLHKPSGQIRCDLVVRDEEGQLTIKAARQRAVRVDAYIVGYDRDGRMVSEFLAPQPVPARLIGTPAVTPHVITVGSYDWSPFGPNGSPLDVPVARGAFRPMRIGALSAYSSPGPSRAAKPFDAVKPDLVAPGQYFVVNRPAGSRDAAPFRDFNGTSAATPYVAGIVALMFEARPELTAAEVKEWLTGYTRSDEFTEEAGSLPNAMWGHGKLHATCVREMLADLKGGRATPPKR